MKATARSKNYIRNLTNKIRELLDLKNDESFDVIHILEFVILDCFDIVLSIVEKHEMPDKYAEYNPIKKELKIREDTYENAINGIGRDRFTIAHEIGHIFLHSNNVSLARSNEEIPIYCNPEWQANTFARELLCPINGIIKGDNDETLAKRYGVSKEVARIQLSQKK